jgi:hypothetical protein
LKSGDGLRRDSMNEPNKTILKQLDNMRIAINEIGLNLKQTLLLFKERCDRIDDRIESLEKALIFDSYDEDEPDN